MQLLTPVIAAAILVTNVGAHPGQSLYEMRAEMAERAAFMASRPVGKRDLSQCSEKMKARGLEQRAIARRAAVAKDARKKRSITADAPYLVARDAATALATDHKSSESYNTATAESIIFSGNSSCILSPEVTQGPYWVSGEYVREDVTEDQEGVELILDTQIIDMDTCDPVTNAVIEIWHCNSTGVYSGVVTSGNGVGTADPTNINNTFLRGLQPTDDEGVAQFTTLFPGHYTGRATHIHVMAHFNGTQFDNGTYSGGYVSHVGQLFFDQDLITQVEATEPYNTNAQDITTNADDSILSEEAAGSHDPFVEYSFLGSDVSEGIFGWIAFGIDLSQQEVLTPAATLYAEGGVANANSGMGGGSGGPGGNGTAPSGGFPSGSAVSSGAIPSGIVTSSSSVVSATAVADVETCQS